MGQVVGREGGSVDNDYHILYFIYHISSIMTIIIRMKTTATTKIRLGPGVGNKKRKWSLWKWKLCSKMRRLCCLGLWLWWGYILHILWRWKWGCKQQQRQKYAMGSSVVGREGGSVDYGDIRPCLRSLRHHHHRYHLFTIITSIIVIITWSSFFIIIMMKRWNIVVEGAI